MGKREAGGNSRRQYERGADQMLMACARTNDDWDDASAPQQMEWFLKYLKSNDLLCEGTVTMYRQCVRVACERILSVEGCDPLEVTQAVQAAGAILNARVGRPDPQRGASRKVKDPLVMELGDVFAHQRAKFIEGGDRLDLILALYLVVMPRIGLRPVELTWARWDGQKLYTRTAKRQGRPERLVPHEHWPAVYKSALGLLIALMPRQLDDAEFETWRNVLASRLARASKWTRKKRRLSLSFARHIAIATWKQAGITPELIAKLAGHAGLRSQYHYAPGSAGYGARFVFLNAAEAEALLGTVPHEDAGARAPIPKVGGGIRAQAASNQSGGAISGATPSSDSSMPMGHESIIDLNDMPTTTVEPKSKNNDEGARGWEEYKGRISAEWDGLPGSTSHSRDKQSGQNPNRQTQESKSGGRAAQPRNDDDNDNDEGMPELDGDDNDPFASR